MVDLISADTYRLLVEESLVGVYLIQDDRVVYANRKFAEVFGYTRQEVLALPDVFQLVAFTQRDEVRESMRQRIEGKIPQVQYTVYGIHKDGRLIHLDVRSLRATHNGRPAIAGTLVDITGQQQLEETLRTLALVDELTGLYNRRGFVTLAERQLTRRQGPLLLIAADLDGLKEINDRFGHSVGDQALVAAAGVLRQTYREADIIARLGGDEFTVFPIEASFANAPSLLERLELNLRAWNERHQREFYLSMSTGTAMLESDLPKDVQQLLSEADSQLYQQKRQRGRVERPINVQVPFWGVDREE